MKKAPHLKAHGGRYGPGKVHYPATGAHNLSMCGSHVYGVMVDADEHPVDCLKCIKISTGERRATYG